MDKKRLVMVATVGVITTYSIFGLGFGRVEVEGATPTPAIKPAKANPAGALRAKIAIDFSRLQKMKPGETVAIPVKVKNTGSKVWVKGATNAYRLSYHWRNVTDNKPVIWDGIRTFITKDVAPGEAITLSAKITSPSTVGEYRLVMDIVKDGKNGGWFSQTGSDGPSTVIKVK